MKINTDVQLKADLTVPVPQKSLQQRLQKVGKTFATLWGSLLFALLLAVAALPLSFFALLQELDSEDDH
ncbi:MAG: hypothetical protein MUC60_18860 [Oscillatoria sp. Prado101]|jgi:hypothetical protein|nr:hypothetical protein [Oscillatoria sp. Prado101]